MREKLLAIIKKWDRESCDYSECVERILNLIQEALPKEKHSVEDDDLTDIHAQHFGIPSEYDGWNNYRKEILKIIK